MTGNGVALVGRRCADNVNLGVEYLLGALDEAGVPAEALWLNEWTDLEPICDRILAGGFSLVGLSLLDGGSAFLPLGLGELLRRRGYRGHITCGGQFATLARRWLLKRYPWLNSVVRFAGESPLLALAGGADPERTPGVTTRAGDGLPAPVLDPLPMTTIPKRGELPKILGHAVAHVAATRGCRGRCAYCSPAELLCQERREGRAAGISRQELIRHGVGGVRRRALEPLCDELAALYHERDVRYVYFVDEHLLPPGEAASIEFLGRLRDGLLARNVKGWGFGCMLRAGAITPAVARALSEAGMVRCFVGLEFASRREAALYGRKADPAAAAGVLRGLADLGVATVSNVMLLHPEATLSTVRRALNWLATLPTGAFELNQMMVYHGTRLQRRLATEGRLLGNPIRYGYAFEGAVMGRFARLFQRLRAEAFANYSLAMRCHDAALTLSLARRLRPTAKLASLARELEQATGQVRGLQIAALGDALAQAEAGAPASAADELVARSGEGASLLVEELDRLAGEVARTADLPADRFSPMLSAAAGAVRMVVAGAALAACTGEPVQAPDYAAPGRDHGAEARPADFSGPDQRVCSTSEKETQKKAVEAAAGKADPCYYGTVAFYAGYPPWVYRQPRVGTGFVDCASPEMNKLVEARMAVIRKAVTGLRRDCLEGESIYVVGAEKAQRETMNAAVRKGCGASSYTWNTLWGVMVVLDSAGKVQEVKSQPGETAKPEAVQCVQKALAGLSFPCLAGHQLCTEQIIVE